MSEDKAKLDDMFDDEDPSFFDEKGEDLDGPSLDEDGSTTLAATDGPNRRVLRDGTTMDPATGEVLDDIPTDMEPSESGTSVHECAVDGETDTKTGDGTEDQILQEDETTTEEDQEPSVIDTPKSDGDTILDRLLNAARHKRVEELCDFGRSYAEMNYEGDFGYIVGRIHEIVKKYTESGFAANISSAVDDLIELSGLMVTLSEPLGFLEGCFDEAEEIRKLAKSALYLEAKKLKVEGWKVTDRDAEHIGRQLSHPYILQKGQADIYAKMVRNLWYGTRHFIDMLNATIMRAGSEVKYIEHSEGAAFRKSDPTSFDPKEIEAGFKADAEAMQIDMEKPEPEKEPDSDGWDEIEIEV